jgi:hypothetical protein
MEPDGGFHFGLSSEAIEAAADHLAEQLPCHGW